VPQNLGRSDISTDDGELPNPLARAPVRTAARPILTIGGDHEVNRVFFEDAQPLRYSGTTGNIALGIAASFQGNAIASNPES
jgi:hypothetical protein